MDQDTGERPQVAGGYASALLRRHGLLLRLLALAVYLALRLLPAGAPLRWHYDWVTGHFLTIARAFNRYGIITLRGVPIQSSGALWPDPDVYANWPPGFGLMLSAVLRLPGDPLLLGRIFAALISVATVVVIWLLARGLWGERRADLAGFLYAAMAVVIARGSLTTHLSMALLLMLAAYHVALAHPSRRGAWLSSVLFALACYCSWEPLLLTVPLLWLGFVRRSVRWRPMAVRFSVAAAVTIAVIAAQFACAPGGNVVAGLAERGYHRVFAGIAADTDQPPTVDPLPTRGLLTSPVEYARVMFDNLQEFGVAHLLTFAFLGVFLWGLRRGESFAREHAAVVVLALPALLWFVLMSNHAMFHEYEMLVWAPFMALGAAVAADGLRELGARAGSERGGYAIALLVVLLVGHLLLAGRAAVNTFIELRSPTQVELGELIRSVTPPDARVLTADRNMIVSWVADRRIYRGIETHADVQWALRHFDELGITDPVYLFGLTEAKTGLDRTWPHRHEAGKFWWWRLR